ncbi:MAG TPA: 50S ribosomal protein L11 methyltransferase [Chitinophagaceae bacterium]
MTSTAHIQVTFDSILPEQQEWVIAHLAEAGYEGFEQSDRELKAFIPKPSFDQYYLKDIAFKYQLTYKIDTIAAQNWNAVWESNFQPIVVEDFVGVRAAFHERLPGVDHEIVITPKMSFGTGHHATTWMMMQQMKQIDFKEKIVFDFGTGTGVLAILAEKLDAKEVIAADIDDWSIENAKENILLNHCSHISIIQIDSMSTVMSFDIILANINKHVLLDNMEKMSSQLRNNGVLLLSGLLVSDEIDIVRAAKKHLLVFAGKYMRDTWLCLKFVR